jgi:hypothetical protein
MPAKKGKKNSGLYDNALAQAYAVAIGMPQSEVGQSRDT